MIHLTETTLGYEVKTQTQKNPVLLHTAHSILDITARRFFQPWIQPPWLFWLSKHHDIYRKSVHALNVFIENVGICECNWYPTYVENNDTFFRVFAALYFEKNGI